LSAKEIYASLHSVYPGIGLTTIYRTLDLLARARLINKLDIGEGQSRYELKSDERKEHHHHLICTKCGKIIDYSDFMDEELELIKKTTRTLAQKYNFSVQDHNIEFYGLC
jgi:Fur family ferric uptake transcriptional regulator